MPHARSPAQAESRRPPRPAIGREPMAAGSCGKHAPISGVFFLDTTSDWPQNRANFWCTGRSLDEVGKKGGTLAIHARLDRAVHQSRMPGAWTLAARRRDAHRPVQQLRRATAQRAAADWPAVAAEAAFAERVPPGWPAAVNFKAEALF